MQILGNLDKEKLGKYKNRITTCKVVLTTERVIHIKEHHPSDYELYGKYLSSIINNPDYILDDNKNMDTILLLKTISHIEKTLQLVIRLNTNTEIQDKYNSILTFWKIKSKTYNQMLRNKEIIWKKLDNIE